MHHPLYQPVGNWLPTDSGLAVVCFYYVMYTVLTVQSTAPQTAMKSRLGTLEPLQLGTALVVIGPGLVPWKLGISPTWQDISYHFGPGLVPWM